MVRATCADSARVPNGDGSPGGEVVVYEAPDGEVSLSVRLKEETVWLTLRQMVTLFKRDFAVVSGHIRNAYREGEPEREATFAKFATVRREGGRSVQRQIGHFNLDGIISVGYRVKSLRGTQFRQWAARTLREHLVRGYTLNERRLAECGLREARETLDLLSRTLRSQSLVSGAGEAVLELVTSYADTWRRRLGYDEDRLEALKGRLSGSQDFIPFASTTSGALSSGGPMRGRNRWQS